MIGLRFVSGLALALWLGGAVAFGSIVAPAAFAVLNTSDAASLVGEALRRFHLVTYVAGVAIVGSLAGMALMGPRPRGFAWRMGVAVLMLAATLASGLWVDRRIRAMREEIGVPVSALRYDDARRRTFGQLHGLSTLLMGFTVAGGVALVFWETRDAR
jgi:hypothetical protein